MSRLGGIDTQYFTDEGDPLSYGLLYCYETGTTTPKGTFHDSDLTVPNTWPIELDAIGVPPDVFFSGTAKFVLKDSEGTTLRTLDPVIDNEFQTGDAVVYRLGDIDSQFFDQNGDILSFGKLYLYKNGTSTPKTTYSDNALTVPNSWPVVLDSVGFLGDVFYQGKARLVLTDQHGVQQRELDEVDTFDIDYGCVVTLPESTVTTTELLIGDEPYNTSLNHSPQFSIFKVSGDNIIINIQNETAGSWYPVVRRSTDGGATWGAEEVLPIPAYGGTAQPFIPHQFYYHPTQGWWIYAFWLSNREGARFRYTGGAWVDYPWPLFPTTGTVSNAHGWQAFTGDGDDFISTTRYAYDVATANSNYVAISRRNLLTGVIGDFTTLVENGNGFWPPQKLGDGTWVAMIQLGTAGAYGNYPIYHFDTDLSLISVTSYTSSNVVQCMENDGDQTIFWTSPREDTVYRHTPGSAVIATTITGAYSGSNTSLHIARKPYMWLALSCTSTTAARVFHSFDDGITWSSSYIALTLGHTPQAGDPLKRQLLPGSGGDWYFAYCENDNLYEVLERFTFEATSGVCS